MEIDINTPKSREFNIFLRFFQLGLHLVIAVQVANLGDHNCRTEFMKIAEPISFIYVGLNLLATLYIHCREKFARI